MKRWFVVVQFYSRVVWSDFRHDGSSNAFKYLRDADRMADELRMRYANPQRWNVVVVRRRVRK